MGAEVELLKEENARLRENLRRTMVARVVVQREGGNEQLQIDRVQIDPEFQLTVYVFDREPAEGGG